MKSIKATDRHRESSGETKPHGHNWPGGTCSVGEQPLDGGSRAKAKGPVKCWKLQQLSIWWSSSAKRSQGPCRTGKLLPVRNGRAGWEQGPLRAAEVLLLGIQSFYSFISFFNAGCVISYISNLNHSFHLLNTLILLHFVIKINTFSITLNRFPLEQRKIQPGMRQQAIRTKGAFLWFVFGV